MERVTSSGRQMRPLWCKSSFIVTFRAVTTRYRIATPSGPLNASWVAQRAFAPDLSTFERHVKRARDRFLKLCAIWIGSPPSLVMIIKSCRQFVRSVRKFNAVLQRFFYRILYAVMQYFILKANYANKIIELIYDIFLEIFFQKLKFKFNFMIRIYTYTNTFTIL